MPAHAPYIMPDGSSLKTYLRQAHEREANKEARAANAFGAAPGKQAQMDLIMRQRKGSTEFNEQMELKAMESVGVRRRRRWLNDKILRDLAGPMSAHDMHTLFEPAPFGGPYRPSPLAQIAEDPAAASMWESFRNIEPEKEARVLKKWEEYVKDQAKASASSAPAQEEGRSASKALQNWSKIHKNGRQALRKANVHSVLQVEMQILEFLEGDDPSSRLSLPLEDGFARLLVHGLCQFYSLLSCSRSGGGSTTLDVYHRQGSSTAGCGHPDITCTDVLLALAELGSDGLTHDGLFQFVRKNIHGSETTSEAGWVVVQDPEDPEALETGEDMKLDDDLEALPVETKV
eukprot:gene30440-35450_t